VVRQAHESTQDPGTAGEALEGADVFIGLSGPGVVSLKDSRR